MSISVGELGPTNPPFRGFAPETLFMYSPVLITQNNEGGGYVAGMDYRQKIFMNFFFF